MDYQTLRATFQGILNRTDCTDTQADQFIGMGLRRAERVIRTPLQRRYINVVKTPEISFLSLPSDYLTMESVFVNGQVLRRASTTETIKPGDYSLPTTWWLEGRFLYFAGDLKDGDEVSFSYFGEFLEPTDDTGSTGYTETIPDLIIYAALIYAADFFLDVRMAAFENFYRTLRDEVQLMADQEATSGGYMVMSHPYEGIA